MGLGLRAPPSPRLSNTGDGGLVFGCCDNMPLPHGEGNRGFCFLRRETGACLQQEKGQAGSSLVP